jgi:cytidyltransferase-like protein
MEQKKSSRLDEIMSFEKKTIGVVRGTFKLLTANHVELLAQAKSIFDSVYVCIDSDERVKNQEKICVLSEKERVAILSNLKSVDAVYVFKTEEEFESQLKIFQANGRKVFYIKGGDYQIDNILESSRLMKEYWIPTVTIGPFDWQSTTDIYNKICSEMNKEIPHFSV